MGISNDKTVTADFTYTDEFGLPTRLVKTVETDYLGNCDFGVLCELFCDFLRACGFSGSVDGKSIKFVDDF